MEILPTYKELKRFLNYNKKTILLSILAVFLLTVTLVAYNIYARNQSESKKQDYISQEEILTISEKDPENVTLEELNSMNEALEADRYEFSFSVEDEFQGIVSNQYVIYSAITQEEVIEKVEAGAGIQIIPNPELAITLVNDNDIMKVSIGTGNQEQNQLIAHAYYDLISNGNIPFFSNKTVYQYDPAPVLEEENWLESAGTQLVNISNMVIIVGIIGVIIIAVIIGLLVAIVKSVFQKTVPLMYKLETETTDKVLQYTKLSKMGEEEFHNSLTYAVSQPENKRKLVLSDQDFSILNQYDSDSMEISDQPRIVVSKEVSNLNPSYVFDEVIVLVKLNTTAKSWYHNQRIQLKRMSAYVTVIVY